MDRLFIETKIAADDDGAIEGIAWKYGEPDRIGDVIVKGAFEGAALPLPMLFGHDGNDPVGAWEQATDLDEGLHLKGRLLVNDLPRAREVSALVKAGAVRGISIGFRTKSATRRPKGGRKIASLELLEASLVSIPMHPGARVTSAKHGIQAITLSEQIKRAAAQLRRQA